MTMQAVIIILALALAGIVKGVTGLGLPLVAIPVMATFIGAQEAILVMALPSAIVNAWQAVQLRAHRSRHSILTMFGFSATFGIAIGAFVFAWMPISWLTWLLVSWIMIYLVLRVTHPNWHLSDTIAVRWAPWAGIVSGVAQATTGAPGPVVATYLHALGATGRSFAFMASVAFATLAALQLVALTVAGLLNWGHLGYGGLACLPAIAAMHWANGLATRISDQQAERLVLLVLALIAAKLAHTAVTGPI